MLQDRYQRTDFLYYLQSAYRFLQRNNSSLHCLLFRPHYPYWYTAICHSFPCNRIPHYTEQPSGPTENTLLHQLNSASTSTGSHKHLPDTQLPQAYYRKQMQVYLNFLYQPVRLLNHRKPDNQAYDPLTDAAHVPPRSTPIPRW